ncbi:MAG: ATP-dependent helicase HrpB, partial [Acidobacteriota bacterium]|nr:ATP-dependent helicase HrpB [Acidobacteriota bacterium]
LVLEPRRIAARDAARRIAEEQGWTLGREVGWQIRFERNFTRDTRILFVTEGILVQRLQRDPFLDGIGAVLFDEIHERSLFADLSLALVRRVQLDARPELKLLPMSATLDGDRLATFLDAPIVASAGRLFPIALDYLDQPPADTPLATLVARGVRQGLEATPGDLLVFLPGVPEIRRAEEALAALARAHDLAIVQLYGDLPSAEQDRVLRPGPRRKVVLATNVAETSITVDGVTGVIDSGWVKESSADPATGLERLALTRNSRASAEQRAGRAGRQAPGWCLRLWSEHEHRGLQARSRPEIRRADLAWTVLQLAAWGERDLAHFPWFEAPDENSLASAGASLTLLGALASDGITPLGRRLAEFPLHPRLALLVLEGDRRGVADDAALVAALLSDRDPTATSEGRISSARTSAQSDLLVKLDSLRAARSSSSSTLLRSRDSLLDAVRRSAGGDSGKRPASPVWSAKREESLQRAIFIAWADRLARRREPGSDRAVMVGGRGVRLARESSVKEAELFVCVSLDDRSGPRSEALVRIASAVERDWLPPERQREVTLLEFEEARQRVVARRRTTFDDLVLDDKEVPIGDAEAASALLAEIAAARIAEVLPRDDADWESLIARLRFLHRACPDLASPAANDTTFTELLSSLSGKAKSFEELRRAPWRAMLLGSLSHAQRSALDREAPERLDVPSGNRIRVDYSDPARPVLAARIQELFGLAETPRLARGRVPVLLHLLAPNGRPQQVTADLASFWTTTYAEVRKELAARYPRHAWPLDPTTAPAERRPRPRSGPR